MRNLLLILYFLIFCHIANAQSISVIRNFEGANINVISINNPGNTINVSPALRTNDTKDIYFFFMVKGYSKTQPFKINLYTTEGNFAPTLAGLSYDLVSWDRIQAVNYSGYKQYTFSPVGDSLYFAVGYPYTYSNMTDHLNTISGNPYLEISDLTLSEDGRSVKLLKITDPSVNDSSKFLVWILARQHAFETHSNYVIEGLINEVLSKDYDASRLRKQALIFIVPMMDVDNAYYGGTGKDQTPVDFNRDWDPPSYWNAVKAAKDKLEETAQQNSLEVFVDSHNPWPGNYEESARLFVYTLYSSGVKSSNVDFFRDVFFEKGGYPLDRFELYPTIGQTSARYADSVYSPGLTLSLETGWVKRTDGVNWDIEKYRNNGKVLLKSVSNYINNIPLPEDIIIDNKDSVRVIKTGEWISSTSVNGYYGDDYIHDNNTQKGFKSIVFLPSVEISSYYELFMRWTSANGRASNVPLKIMHSEGVINLQLSQLKKGGGWVSLGIYKFSPGNSDRIIIETTSTNGFVIADAVRLSRRDSPVNIASDNRDVPGSFILYQNYPNPFNPETTIKYRIPEGGHTTLIKIHDILGREVFVLINKEQSSGEYEIKADLSSLVGGVYFYRLISGGYSDVKKLILLK